MPKKEKNRLAAYETKVDSPITGKPPASFEAPGVAFVPLSEIAPSGEPPFALLSSGAEQILKTPFGMFKFSVKVSKELTALGNQLDTMFSEELSAEAFEQLEKIIASIPQLKELMGQIPEIKQFMDQAAQMLKSGVAQVQKQAAQHIKTAKTAGKLPLTTGMSFEKLYNARGVN